MSNGTTSVVNTVISVLPAILALIRGSRQPTDPALTNEQVLEGLQSVIASSLQKDASWKAANPPADPDTPADPSTL